MFSSVFRVCLSLSLSLCTCLGESAESCERQEGTRESQELSPRRLVLWCGEREGEREGVGAVRSLPLSPPSLSHPPSLTHTPSFPHTPQLSHLPHPPSHTLFPSPPDPHLAFVTLPRPSQNSSLVGPSFRFLLAIASPQLGVRFGVGFSCFLVFFKVFGVFFYWGGVECFIGVRSVVGVFCG